MIVINYNTLDKIQVCVIYHELKQLLVHPILVTERWLIAKYACQIICQNERHVYKILFYKIRKGKVKNNGIKKSPAWFER